MKSVELERHAKMQCLGQYDEFFSIISNTKEINNNHSNNLNKSNSIPNIVHYIYGLKEQSSEFPFLFYYGILSNILINQSIKIYMTIICGDWVPITYQVRG